MKQSEEKQPSAIKELAVESGKALVEGLTFSVKTIRQGLQWVNEDDSKKQTASVKKKRKGSPKIIIING